MVLLVGHCGISEWMVNICGERAEVEDIGNKMRIF